MQSAEQQKQHQEGQATRLVALELMLNTLAAKTEVRSADSLREHLENMPARMHGEMWQDGVFILLFHLFYRFSTVLFNCLILSY